MTVLWGLPYVLIEIALGELSPAVIGCGASAAAAAAALLIAIAVGQGGFAASAGGWAGSPAWW